MFVGQADEVRPRCDEKCQAGSLALDAILATRVMSQIHRNGPDNLRRAMI